MKVKDLISKMIDNYMRISISVYKRNEFTGERYIVGPHATDDRNIPGNIWNKEIRAMVLYYDRLSIEVDA